MVLTTFNKELYEQGLKEDAREEGLAEGLAKGRASGVLSTLLSLVRKGFLSVETAAKEAQMEEAAFLDLLGKKEE